MIEIKTLNTGDVFGVKLEKQNVFYPCQILGIDLENTERIAVVLMNYFNENIPTIEDLKTIKPLIKNHHNWKDETMAFWTSTVEFEQLTFIGNIKPIYNMTEVNDNDRIFNQFQTELQFLWQKLPDEKIKQYKEAKKSEVRQPTKVFIEEQKDKSFWKSLNSLPCLSNMSCTYWHDELLEYVAQNPLISELEIRNAKLSTLDLSKTGVQKLLLDATNVENIILSKDVQFLNLFGDCSKLKNITDIFSGKYVRLFISQQKILPKFSGFEELETFSMVCKEINIKRIVDQFKNLRNLTLWGETGKLSNILDLQGLKNLEYLTIYDAYGFNDFPRKEQLPNLCNLTLTGITKTAGLKAKKEFTKINPYIKQLRDEEWLKANLDNPFNKWDGRDGTKPASAKKAMKNYTETYKKLQKKGITKEEIKEILFNFINIFNGMDKKNSIDTIEREEIWDVFKQLTKLTNLTHKESEDLFETTRDF